MNRRTRSDEGNKLRKEETNFVFEFKDLGVHFDQNGDW